MKKFITYASWLNEKFIKDSDPISDMGIGIFSKRNFNTYSQLHDFLLTCVHIILNLPNLKTAYKKILKVDYGHHDVINDELYDKILEYCQKYITIQSEPITKIIDVRPFKDKVIQTLADLIQNTENKS